MIVVADTSPLIVLAKIQQLQVLPALFGQVIIPPEVRAELLSPAYRGVAYDLAAHLPPWLLERSPLTIEMIPLLNKGERAAISLALEVKADFILIDEMQGRKAAMDRGLQITGAIGVLERAAKARHLDLAQAFSQLKQTNFWVPHDFLDRRLELFRQQDKGAP